MVEEMRDRVPPLIPVRFYLRDIESTGMLGFTEMRLDADGMWDHFNVVVDKNLDWQAMWQTIIHEWAHALSWSEGHATVCDHDPEWGLAYARIYQEVMEP